MRVVQKKNPYDFVKYGLICKETGTAHGWYTIFWNRRDKFLCVWVNVLKNSIMWLRIWKLHVAYLSPPLLEYPNEHRLGIYEKI